VILAPGEYSDVRGDLGPANQVKLPPDISLRAVSGLARPRIRLSGGGDLGALVVDSGDLVSHLEIVTDTNPNNITILGGVVQDLIARSSTPTPGDVVCEQLAGLLRNSVCLSSGPNGTALGAKFRADGARDAEIELHQVTAVAAGADSFGVNYQFELLTLSAIFKVNGSSVIAKGTAADVAASGVRASVNVAFDHSAYATTSASGTARVKSPLSDSTNVIAPPLLAADGFHQLESSPTVDKGKLDPFSTLTDIDGQLREIGVRADIGADELGHPSSTSLVCAPTSLFPGEVAICKARVADTSPEPTAPEGTVRFLTNGAGVFENAGRCLLFPVEPPATAATCTILYEARGGGARPHTLSAVYLLGPQHSGSVGVLQLPVAGPGGGGEPPAAVAPQTKLGKHPRRKGTGRTAIFTFASSQAGSRFECALDKRPFRRCSSPFKAKVRPGRHIFGVRAVSAQGAADLSPAIFTWKVGRR
jgi:hypothetical protein